MSKVRTGKRGSSRSQLFLETLGNTHSPIQVIDPVSGSSECFPVRSEPLCPVVFPTPVRGWEPPPRTPSAPILERRSHTHREQLPDEDVRELPAALWGLLPLPASLGCQSYYSSVSVVLTGSKAVWRALRRRRRVVFGTLEWSELVSAFEDERASPASFVKWCDYKAINPAWTLKRRECTGLIGDARSEPLGSSVGAVLDGWGIELLAVSYGAEVPQC